MTGAHAASVTSVAAGATDIAAIDFVSWRLARRYRPESGRLRVLMLTDPTPGIACIARRGTDAAPHARALAKAIAALDPGTADALGIAGFAPLRPADYAVIAERFAAAARAVEDAAHPA